MEQAIDNNLNYIPSPKVLSKHLTENIKPVRLVRNGDKYDLVEGRIRYWAWVITFGNETPIPAYIRENF